MNIQNPYLEEIKDVIPFLDWYQDDLDGIEYPQEDAENAVKRHMAAVCLRTEMIRKYSFAIPTQEIIEKIVKYSPIIEVGAGTGYWAWVLRQSGATVEAFDAYPPSAKSKNRYFKNATQWSPVKQGVVEVVKNYSNHSLFLCWPPYNKPMATDCLKQYSGKRLIYIGESEGGCTCDDQFHKLLSKEWDLVENTKIVRWVGMFDELFIYNRKQ